MGMLSACLLLLWGCSMGHKRPKVAIVSPHLEQEPQAMQRAAQEFDGLMEIGLFGLSEQGTIPVLDVQELSTYDLVIFEALGARVSLLQEAIDSLKGKTKVLFLDTPLAEGNVEATDYPDLSVYWKNGNAKNYEGMLGYIGQKFFQLQVAVTPPVVFPTKGFYHPEQDSLVGKVEDYLQWYRQHKAIKADAMGNAIPAIGIVFYQSNYVKKDLAHVHALIHEIEKQGAIPVPFMATGAFQLDRAFMHEGQSTVDAVCYGGMFLDFANPERGRLAAKRLDVPLLGTYTHYYKDRKAWEREAGGFAPEMSDRFYFTERDGVLEPMLVGAMELNSEGLRMVAPIDSQITWRVARAMAWAKLRHLKNKEKKLVITYFSEGNGKANVGADIDAYLDAPASLVQLLQALKGAGYDVGEAPLPGARQLARRMAEHASNVGVWAPEVLRQRGQSGEVIRISSEAYGKWLAAYPTALQQQLQKQWGEAPGELMTTVDSSGRRDLRIPILRFGNVVLAPHPNWGLQDRPEAIYQQDELAPHHAYIAFYEWMKHHYQADAFLSLFTQLSLMPGKAEGPSIRDWNGALIGHLPHITVSPLIAGSASKNKRRASALTIGYLTEVTTAGLSDSLLSLKSAIDEWHVATNLSLKDRLERTILQQADALKLARDLGYRGQELPAADRYIPEMRSYLTKLGKQRMPHGGHILGIGPQGKVREEMLKEMIGEEPVSAAEREKKVEDYGRLLDSTPNELTQLLRALSGRYIETGPTDDPIRNPESLPSGRNPAPVNTKGIPTRTAWELGKRLGDQLLLQHEQQQGSGAMPKKAAFVLWSSEITHTEGVTEAEIMWLMGVKPVWNSKGQVMDIALIPAEELGRPRIDVLITTSGTYRDHFRNNMNMLDKAIQLVNAADEPENYVRANSLRYQKALGLPSLETAALRMFSSKEGSYSTNLEFAVENGEAWEKDSVLADLYLDRMGHAYGEMANAQEERELFRLNVKDIEVAAFSRSSSVYGILDHPMVAAYFGAYSLASRNNGGKRPSLFINDMQDTAAAEVTPIATFFHREMRSRYLNPKWIESMKEHGYDGARYMQSFAENLLMWDVTDPDMVADDDWNSVYETYVEDRNDLGMQDYFNEYNPYAQQALTATMLEASEKGYWGASPEQLAELAQQLGGSVVRHGLACNTAVCNSPKLSAYVEQLLEQVPGGEKLRARYTEQLAAVRSVPAAAKLGNPASQVSGQKIAEEVSSNQTMTKWPSWKDGWVALLLLACLLIGFFKPLNIN